MEIKIYIIFLVIFCALLGASGQILFKLSSKNFVFNPLLWYKNPLFLLGAFLYACSAALFVFSLKFGNLSILYPIIATSYIWVTLFAVIILKESFSPIKWIGIILILLGIVITTK